MDTLHSFDFRQELTHTALRVEQRGSEVNFLSVLYPRVGGEGVPVFETVELEEGQAVKVGNGSRQDWVWIADSESVQEQAIYTVSNDDFGQIRTNAAFGYVGIEDAGYFSRIGMQEGSYIERSASANNFGGFSLFEIAADTTISLNLAGTNNRFTGYVIGPETGYSIAVSGLTDQFAPKISKIRIPLLPPPRFSILIEEVEFRGTRVEIGEDNTVLLAGKGSFSFSYSFRPADRLIGDIDGSSGVDFDDFFLFADNFGQADFDPAADIDGDGDVDFDDFFLFADNFGKSGG